MGGPSLGPSCGASLFLLLATNAASIAMLASLGFDIFFVAALFVYGPCLSPFFTPENHRAATAAVHPEADEAELTARLRRCSAKRLRRRPTRRERVFAWGGGVGVLGEDGMRGRP